MKKIFTRHKIILIISFLFLNIALLEAGMHLQKFVFLFLQEYRNAFSLKQKRAYCILCIGDSITGLGGEGSYPVQLEKILNRQNTGIKFSVINKGIAGGSTEAIVSQLEDSINKYKPHMVIAMMGASEGDDTTAYKKIPSKKFIRFLNLLRTYKWVKLAFSCYINPYRQEEKVSQKALNINSQNDENYITSALSYMDQGEHNKSEEMFKKAMEGNLKNDQAYIGLGWLLVDQGKYNKAEEMFKRAMEINPQNKWVYIALGRCYVDQGKYSEAQKIYKEAIEINPEDELAYIILGWNNVYFEKRYDKDEALLKKAIELNPKSGKLLGMVALLYDKQKKGKFAEEYFNKATRVRLEYYNPTTRRNYQRLKEILNQRGIQLVCVQYPLRNIEPLKKMLEPHKGIIFVDNEMVFKEAVKQTSFDKYFTNMFLGDSGHCTSQGNRLLAENIARVILKDCF